MKIDKCPTLQVKIPSKSHLYQIYEVNSQRGQCVVLQQENNFEQQRNAVSPMGLFIHGLPLMSTAENNELYERVQFQCHSQFSFHH